METVEEITEATLVLQKPEPTLVLGTERKKPLGFSFSAQAVAFEEARYFWMSVLLTVQSCLGAVACMFILYSGGNIVELALCAAITMGSNAMFIGLASPKVCLGVFYASVVLNLLFTLINLG